MQTQRRLLWPKRPVPPPDAYFVGRRPYEAAEVYLVERDRVERLRSDSLGATVALDWRLGPTELLELSHALLTRAGGFETSRELEVRFALILREFPESGFVLNAEVVADWLDNTGDGDPAPRTERPAPSRLRRLRSALRRWWPA